MLICIRKKEENGSQTFTQFFNIQVFINQNQTCLNTVIEERKELVFQIRFCYIKLLNVLERKISACTLLCKVITNKNMCKK